MKTYTMKNGTEVDFVLTLFSKSKLEKLQSEAFGTLQSGDVGSLMITNTRMKEILFKTDELQREIEIDENCKAKNTAAIKALQTETIDIIMSEIDPIEATKVIWSGMLANRKKPISRFDEIMADMEENLGLKKAWSFVCEVKEEAFLELDKMKKISESKQAQRAGLLKIMK